MRAPVSFFDLFQETLRLISSGRFVYGFGVVFGILALLATELNQRVLPFIESENTSPHALIRTILDQQEIFLLTLGGLLILGLLRSLLRGPYFLLMENMIIQKLSLEKEFDLKPKVLRRSAWTALSFEIGYLITLALLWVVIALPLTLAFRLNPGAFEFLLPLGLILLTILSIVFFYLKEFALLYSLLAHSKPRLSLELSLKLFQKHTWLILLFGLFLMAIAFLFTFVVNLVIIASDLIPLIWLQVGLSAVGTIVVFGLAEATKETLRLLFFHTLAATPKPPVLKVKSLIEEKHPGSAPTV